MTAFTVSREVRAPAAEMWDLLVDWHRHAGWVPLTTMRVDENGGHGVGATFVGRTALGRLGFDDVMRVQAWRPPDGDAVGRLRVEHVGRVLGGAAGLEVRPVTPTRCTVTWWEDMRLLPRVPGPLGRVVALLAGPPTVLAGRRIFARVLRLAADQAEQAHAIRAAGLP
jgi:hypothetical protein